MDAGDADEEMVFVALEDDERVLAVAGLRVRKASTRASGRARGRGDDGRGSRMDAGDADVEAVFVALHSDDIVATSSLRAVLRPREPRTVQTRGGCVDIVEVAHDEQAVVLVGEGDLVIIYIIIIIIIIIARAGTTARKASIQNQAPIFTTTPICAQNIGVVVGYLRPNTIPRICVGGGDVSGCVLRGGGRS